MSARRLLFLVGLALAAAPSASASAATTLPACASLASTNCVVSVARNSTPVAYPTAPGDPYQVSAIRWTDAGTHHFNFTITRTGLDPFSLDITDVWNVIVNTGTTYPEETFARGQAV